MSANLKIAFLGLDNAGKTSILIALKRKYNFQEELANLKPTTHIARTSFKFLNMEIIQHDFGGQEKYRNEYLNQKDRFLSNTDLIFYVVDIQDENRFKESLSYFNEIAGYFKEEKIKIPIIILMHKFDPKFRREREYISRIISLKNEFNEWLQYHDLYFFESSIYDLYSLVDSFSFGMAQLFNKRELIDKYLDSIGTNFDTIALLLFDENGIALSEYYKSHLTSNEREKIHQLFINIERRIYDKTSNIYEFSDWINYNTRVSGVIQSFSVGYIKFYLLFIIDETSEEEAVKLLDKFESYKDDLTDILQGLISNASVSI